MKRFTLLLALAFVAVLVFAPAAFANFAIHGGYAADTDACAGCHRAHTSVSSVTWADAKNNNHSALLTSNAEQLSDFCLACHDNSAQGADTNVEGGVYKGELYGSHDATLNGGFFGLVSHTNAPSTSSHEIYRGWGAYGDGTGMLKADGTVANTVAEMSYANGKGPEIQMSCASCHDPHGSSNYRLLADRVNAKAVGGYTGGGEVPDPWVISNEIGYPNGVVTARNPSGQLGWLKHEPGHTQIENYVPNYTTTYYAKAPGVVPNASEGMSGWCAGCHTHYTDTGAPHGAIEMYDAGDGWAYQERHRHPVNIALNPGVSPDTGAVPPFDSTGGYGDISVRALTQTLTAPGSMKIPLAQNPTEVSTYTVGTTMFSPTSNILKSESDWMDCMTCHVAHGTAVTMKGYANVDNVVTGPDGTGNALVPDSGVGGVDPTNDSALLRMDNRGVCEDCHNK